MMESLDDAKEELKRVDHLVYVSLKYTRTVDVLLNAVGRMIEAYDFLFEAIIKHAIEQKKVKEIPGTPIERGNLVKELYKDDPKFQENVDLCFLLRKLSKVATYKKESEFRRHVAMRTIIDKKEQVLNIDVITEYYLKAQDFYKHIETIIVGPET